MGESLSHKFGQLIGELLEIAILPRLQKFASNYDLYLDKQGKRLVRSGTKVSWIDGKGNKHDLDFVLERGGTENNIGVPVAFIESAWRRYTKHSRNKAQEIQGAIIPLFEKYRNSSPFLGVLLAGVFTEKSLTQLESIGFQVLYFQYDTVVEAFNRFGIDARFDEKTSEEEFRIKIDCWNSIPNKHEVARYLMELNKDKIDVFFAALKVSASRFIERIIILPLHGLAFNVQQIAEAIDFVKSYTEDKSSMPLDKFEITIRYNTGDRIDASFKDKINTIHFLENYL